MDGFTVEIVVTTGEELFIKHLQARYKSLFYKALIVFVAAQSKAVSCINA